MKPLILFRHLLIATTLAAMTATSAQAGDSIRERLQTAAAMRIDWQQLNLSTSQKAKLAGIFWDAKSERDAFHVQMQDLLVSAQTELAKADADLNALTTQSEPLLDQRLADARQVRDRLIAFYNDDLDAEQQATARQILLQRLDRIAQLTDALESLRTLLSMP